MVRKACTTPSLRPIDKRGLDVQLVQTGCFGFCAEEPLVNVWTPGPAAASCCIACAAIR